MNVLCLTVEQAKGNGKRDMTAEAAILLSGVLKTSS